MNIEVAISHNVTLHDTYWCPKVSQNHFPQQRQNYDHPDAISRRLNRTPTSLAVRRTVDDQRRPGFRPVMAGLGAVIGRRWERQRPVKRVDHIASTPSTDRERRHAPATTERRRRGRKLGLADRKRWERF